MNSIILITAMTATTGLMGGGKHCGGGGGKMHHKTRAVYASAPAPARCGSMMSYALPMQGQGSPASSQIVPPAPMVPMASPGAPPAPPKPIM